MSSKFIHAKEGEPPIMQMKRWYEEHPQLEDHEFDSDLRCYLVQGYVYSGPEVFVMARLVRHDAAHSSDPFHTDPNPDCWYIEAAAGDLLRLWEIQPKEMKWARWIWGDCVYTVPMERAKKLLTTMLNSGRK